MLMVNLLSQILKQQVLEIEGLSVFSKHALSRTTFFVLPHDLHLLLYIYIYIIYILNNIADPGTDIGNDAVYCTSQEQDIPNGGVYHLSFSLCSIEYILLYLRYLSIRINLSFSLICIIYMLHLYVFQKLIFSPE